FAPSRVVGVHRGPAKHGVVEALEPSAFAPRPGPVERLGPDPAGLDVVVVMGDPVGAERDDDVWSGVAKDCLDAPHDLPERRLGKMPVDVSEELDPRIRHTDHAQPLGLLALAYVGQRLPGGNRRPDRAVAAAGAEDD